MTGFYECVGQNDGRKKNLAQTLSGIKIVLKIKIFAFLVDIDFNMPFVMW